MISTWCANGNPEYCQPGETSHNRIVPEGLLRASCYAFHEELSASCQIPYLEKGAEADILSGRGKLQNTYPPLFYKTMGVMAGPDIERSVIIMRLFNSALFVGLVVLSTFCCRSAEGRCSFGHRLSRPFPWDFSSSPRPTPVDGRLWE